MVTIRPATLDDLQTLRAFEQGIVTAERPFDVTLRAGPIRYYDIAAMLTDARVRFLIAESAGVPVGCGFARLDVAKPYLRHAGQRVSELRLEVYSANAKAGFEPNMLEMRLQLPMG